MSIQWAFVVFKLLAGAGAGVVGFVGLAELFSSKSESKRKAILIGLILLLIAGCAALLQVGKPERIMSVVRNLSPDSPVSWELLSYGAALIVGVVYALLSKRENVLVKIVAAVAVIVAVAIGFTTGYSHMSMVGMPSWHNIAIPAGFLFSALLLGSLLYLAAGKQADDKKANTIITWIAIILAFLTALSYTAYGFTANLGEYAVLYWIAAPFIGGVASIACTVGMKMKESALWLYAALLTALIGSITLRAVIWAVVETGLRTGDSIVHI